MRRGNNRWLLAGVLLCLAGAVAPVLAESDEALMSYRELPLSSANLAALTTTLTTERAQLLGRLQTKYPDRPGKVAQNADLVAYDWLLGQAGLLKQGLGRGAIQGLADFRQKRAFVRMQRVHYSVRADLGDGGGAGSSLLGGLQVVGHVVAGPMGLGVPNVIDPDDRLGERLARAESPYLFRPDGSGPVPLPELARMSAFEVSRLQPAADHVALRPVAPGSHFDAFAAELVKRIRAQGGELARFDPSYARHLVFFDELSGDATSPKITTKDRYGLKWKLKWGDEVHVGVALSRLYMDLGGSYADLLYYAGPGETLLVLAPPGARPDAGPRTFDELANMLLASKFKFHAQRYLLAGPCLKDGSGKILGSGKVDAAMAERESLDDKYIGAYYVKFKECQLSLYNPAIKRLGAAAMSRLGARDDRVCRGSLVLNCWVKNRDVKDENSRVGLLFDPASGKFDQVVEFQSDLGTALGTPIAGGEINSVQKKMIVLMPQSINFSLRPLFQPRAWRSCTWADARWMALRIARLSRADLERAFADSGWPVFAQRVAVERLISRRNELVEVFELGADGVAALPCDPAFSMVDPKTGDELVRRGRISGRAKTVAALEAAVHPEGLDRVLCRFFD